MTRLAVQRKELSRERLGLTEMLCTAYWTFKALKEGSCAN